MISARVFPTISSAFGSQTYISLREDLNFRHRDLFHGKHLLMLLPVMGLNVSEIVEIIIFPGAIVLTNSTLCT